MRSISSLATLVFIVILIVGLGLTYAMYGISSGWGSNSMPPSCMLSAAVLGTMTIAEFCFNPS